MFCWETLAKSTKTDCDLKWLTRNYVKKLHNLSFLQVLNLFLALLLNAFDNGDDDGENEDENDRDSEGEESFLKQILSKLTQTKTTSVFPVHEYPSADGSCNSYDEIQTTGRKQNMGKEYSTVGKRALYWSNPFAGVEVRS